MAAPNRELTEQDVSEIRSKFWRTEISSEELAAEFDVSQQTLLRVLEDNA